MSKIEIPCEAVLVQKERFQWIIKLLECPMTRVRWNSTCMDSFLYFLLNSSYKGSSPKQPTNCLRKVSMSFPEKPSFQFLWALLAPWSHVNCNGWICPSSCSRNERARLLIKVERVGRIQNWRFFKLRFEPCWYLSAHWESYMPS